MSPEELELVRHISDGLCVVAMMWAVAWMMRG